MKKTCNICKKEFDTEQGLSRYWRDYHFNICSYSCAQKSMAMIIAKINKELIPEEKISVRKDKQ